MVLQFLISTVTQKKLTLLYSKTFETTNIQQEENEIQENLNYGDLQRPSFFESLRERLVLELNIASVSPLGNIQSLVDPYSLNLIELGGIFSLNEKQTRKTVIWHLIQNQWLFIMVCNWHENRIAAIRVMKQIIRCSLERLENIRPMELLKKIHVISVILDVLLPNGQLCFLHQHNLLNNFKKIDTIVKGS